MKYKRILLKLSGEALMGDQQFGISQQRLIDYATEIKSVVDPPEKDEKSIHLVLNCHFFN